MILKLALLISLIRLLLVTEKVFLCSGIYGVSRFALSLVFTGNWEASVQIGAISFAVTTVYFWWLNRHEISSSTWWFIAIFMGFPIWFV